MKAAGSPIATTSEAASANPSCGCRFQVHRAGLDTEGRSAIPSNRRSAAPIAASRLAGRGGGGVGK